MSAWTKPYWPRSGDRGSRFGRQHLLAHEVPQPRLQLALRVPETAASDATVNVWPRTEASWSSDRSRGVERVEAGRDERVERVRDLQIGQVADRPIAPSAALEAAVEQQLADGLDGVQRDAFRAPQDGRPGARRAGPARGPPAGRPSPRRQRIERRRHEVAPPGAPGAVTLEELRPGQREQQDGMADGPLREVVDEVEQALVGPVDVLEHEHGRALLADPLEEGAPGGEQLLPVERPQLLDAQQAQQLGLDPAALGLVGHVLREGGRDPRPGRGRVVALGQAGALADHLTQRPEGDALAVGRGAALVPVDTSSTRPSMYFWNSQVSRLLPVPAWPVTDTNRRRRVPIGGMEQVLEQPQLLVAAHEGRLEPLGATDAADAWPRRAAPARPRPEPSDP